jgi:hypothetical protein
MNTLSSNAAVLVIAAGLVVGGCDRATSERAEADAQRAGKKISEAAQKTGDRISEGAHKLAPKLERAGEKIGEAAEKTGDRISTTTTRITTGERTSVELNGKPVREEPAKRDR